MISIKQFRWSGWVVAIIALVGLGALTKPVLAQSGDATEDERVPIANQAPPAPSNPRPAPAQIPGRAGTPASTARITGTVTYRERIALPANAVVQVSLRDISRVGAPAVVLGEQSIATQGRQVPIPFEIPYDPATIDERLTYSIRARITVDGRLLFTSTTATLAITGGHPTHVEVVVERV